MAIKINTKIKINKPELGLKHLTGSMMVDKGRVLTSYSNSQFAKMVFGVMKKNKVPCFFSRGFIIEQYKDKTDDKIADDTIETFKKMKTEMKEVKDIWWERVIV